MFRNQLTISFFIFSILQFPLFAQKGSWLELGLTGTGGANIITNKNSWNDQKTITSNVSLCYGYGLKLALNINQYHEILVNAEMAKKTEKYDITLNANQFHKTLLIDAIDVAPLYRFHSAEGAYLELGPQFSFINKVNEQRDGNTKDITDKFTENYVSGVFGFGSNFIQANAVTVTMGFRFNYSFTDLLSPNGRNSSNVSYPINDLGIAKTYSDYAPTKVYAAMLHLELNFDLGYFVRSNCKRQRVSFLTF